MAELEELVTSLWMHKPGDCDACNKLIATRPSQANGKRCLQLVATWGYAHV